MTYYYLMIKAKISTVVFLSGALIAVLASCVGPKCLKTIPTKALTAPEETLPLSFDGITPVFDVYINGKGPYPFGLNTSKRISVIGSDLCDELELPEGSVNRTEAVFSGVNVDTVSYRWIDLLTVGNSEFHGFDCARSTQPTFNNMAQNKLYGTLGMGLFYDSVIVLNYKEKTITLTEEPLSPDDPDTIPLVFSYSGAIIIEGTLNEQKQKMLISAEAGVGLFLREPLRDTVSYLNQPIFFKHMKSVAGIEEVNRGQMDGYIQIGQYRIENPTVYTSPYDRETISKGASFDAELIVKANVPSVALGFLLLNHFELSIDQRNGLFRLRRLCSEPTQLK